MKALENVNFPIFGSHKDGDDVNGISSERGTLITPAREDIKWSSHPPQPKDARPRFSADSLLHLLSKNTRRDCYEPALYDLVAAKMEACLREGRPAQFAKVSEYRKFLLILAALMLSIWGLCNSTCSKIRPVWRYLPWN